MLGYIPFENTTINQMFRWKKTHPINSHYLFSKAKMMWCFFLSGHIWYILQRIWSRMVHRFFDMDSFPTYVHVPAEYCLHDVFLSSLTGFVVLVVTNEWSLCFHTPQENQVRKSTMPFFSPSTTKTENNIKLINCILT